MYLIYTPLHFIQQHLKSIKNTSRRRVFFDLYKAITQILESS